MKLNTEFMTKERQYRSNQGRSPRQMETSYKIVGYSLLAFIIMIVILAISNLFQ